MHNSYAHQMGQFVDTTDQRRQIRDEQSGNDPGLRESTHQTTFGKHRHVGGANHRN